MTSSRGHTITPPGRTSSLWTMTLSLRYSLVIPTLRSQIITSPTPTIMWLRMIPVPIPTPPPPASTTGRRPLTRPPPVWKAATPAIPAPSAARPTSRSSPPRATTGRSLSTSTWSITRMAPWPPRAIRSTSAASAANSGIPIPAPRPRTSPAAVISSHGCNRSRRGWMRSWT